MANQPQGRAKRPPTTPVTSGPSPARYWLYMIIGGVACLLGLFWGLQSYSSDPPKFYIGGAVGVIGLIFGLYGAIRLNITRRR